MNQQPTQFNRFRVMSALALAVLGVYLVVLFNIQVVHHDDYLAQSTQAIARVEDVKASRGIITDRSGRTLVSNQYTYSLTFDTSLLKNRADQNEAILRLVQLCREQNVEWVDNLPVSQSTPAAFTVDDLTNTQKRYFFKFLRELKPAREILENYVNSHPELMKPAETDDTAAEDSATDSQTAAKTPDLDNFDTARLTSALLLQMGFTPPQLMDWLRDDLKISADYSDTDARAHCRRAVRVAAAEAGHQQQRLCSGGKCWMNESAPSSATVNFRGPRSAAPPHGLTKPPMPPMYWVWWAAFPTTRTS